MGRTAVLIVFLCACLCTPAGSAQVDPSPPADAIASEEVTPVPEDASDGRTDGRGVLDAAEADFIGRLNDEIDRRSTEGDSGEEVPSASSGGSSRNVGKMLRGICALCCACADSFGVLRRSKVG